MHSIICICWDIVGENVTGCIEISMGVRSFWVKNKYKTEWLGFHIENLPSEKPSEFPRVNRLLPEFGMSSWLEMNYTAGWCILSPLIYIYVNVRLSAFPPNWQRHWVFYGAPLLFRLFCVLLLRELTVVFYVVRCKKFVDLLGIWLSIILFVLRSQLVNRVHGHQFKSPNQ